MKINGEVVRLYREKKYDEALPSAQKSVQLAERIFGKDHLETARSLQNLAFIQFAKKDLKSAESTFEKAADVYRKIPDLNKQTGTGYGEILETLASIKFDKGLDSAEKFYQIALEWREKSDGIDSVRTTTALSGLASINYWKRDYKKAAQLLQKLLDVISKNKTLSKDDAALVFHRAECAFDKAGMKENFETIKGKYASDLNLEFPSPDAPEAQNGKKVVQVGVVNGKALQLVKPAYPAAAKKDRAQGQVRVKVLINEGGDVVQACAENKAHPALMESSEASAYGSKFTPTTILGKPVRVTGVIVYNYKAM